MERHPPFRRRPVGQEQAAGPLCVDDITLDQEWAGLIEEAVRRYVEGED